jgi:hypothetical protein
MEKRTDLAEKTEKFSVPGLGSVRFRLRHRCRSLRAARGWEKKFAPTHYVRIEHEGKFYHVYFRRK